MVRIMKTKMPKDVTVAEYMRYFRDLADEYAARAARLEERVASERPLRSVKPVFKDLNVERPRWEIEDVCCFTTITKQQLQQVLPPLFDAMRRHSRVCARLAALSEEGRVARLRAAGWSDEEIASIPDDGDRRSLESEIDEWLDGMVGPCRWKKADHLGRTCQKPVPWSKEDMGGGRS